MALDQGKGPDGFVILKFPVALDQFVGFAVNQVILHIGGYGHHQQGALMGSIIVAVNEKQRADRPDLFDCTDIAQAFPVPSVQIDQLPVLPVPVGHIFTDFGYIFLFPGAVDPVKAIQNTRFDPRPFKIRIMLRHIPQIFMGPPLRQLLLDV